MWASQKTQPGIWPIPTLPLRLLSRRILTATYVVFLAQVHHFDELVSVLDHGDLRRSATRNFVHIHVTEALRAKNRGSSMKMTL